MIRSNSYFPNCNFKSILTRWWYCHQSWTRSRQKWGGTSPPQGKESQPCPCLTRRGFPEIKMKRFRHMNGAVLSWIRKWLTYLRRPHNVLIWVLLRLSLSQGYSEEEWQVKHWANEWLGYLPSKKKKTKEIQKTMQVLLETILAQPEKVLSKQSWILD